MVHSMTAFARTQVQSEFGLLVCEMRSINHRYLEMHMHLPDVLRALEMPIRERIKKILKRGKVECSIRLQSNTAATDSVSINTDLAKSLCDAASSIAEMMPNAAPIDPTQILRFPNMMQSKEVDADALKNLVLKLVDQALKELVAARKREGTELTKLFNERLDYMRKELAKARERYPEVVTEAKERLLKRFEDASVDLDSTRLEQEMVMYAQKLDVAEEIERAETHIAEIRRVLDEGGLIGRRLDFLLQELNREANTLGSKSIDTIMTHAAVEMKVLIEQFREQVQNIE